MAPTTGPQVDPQAERVHDDNYVLNELKSLLIDGGATTHDRLQKAVIAGDAYRVSKRHTLADGEEFIIHVDPADAGGTVHIATPAIDTAQRAEIDVWENADPQTNLVDDLFVHAMRYDVDPETPEATVQRVSDSGLDTSSADQTEQTNIRSGGDYNTPGDTELRGIWRTIPVGETVSFVITDQSNGSGNVYGFDTVVYEGDTLPE